MVAAAVVLVMVVVMVLVVVVPTFVIQSVFIHVLNQHLSGQLQLQFRNYKCKIITTTNQEESRTKEVQEGIRISLIESQN